jgi:hypothetical protein
MLIEEQWEQTTMRTHHFSAVGLLILAGVISTSSAAQQASVDDILEERTSYQAQAQDAQQRIDNLDDETLSLIARYGSELERYSDLQTYNDNLRNLLANQQLEQQRLASELEEIEVLRQDIVPLMVEMIEVLERFIALDQPMLLEERRARLAKLETNMSRSDVELAEKFRRLLEAYQIEAEYGQSLEAYEGTLEDQGAQRTVDFLRVGRVGLYYLSLDRQSAGIWERKSRQWHSLPAADIDAIEYAIRVARKQAPPNLFELPLWTETGS